MKNIQAILKKFERKKPSSNFLTLSGDVIGYLGQWLTIQDLFHLSRANKIIEQRLENIFKQKIAFYFDYLKEDKDIRAILDGKISAPRKFIKIAKLVFNTPETFKSFVTLDAYLNSQMSLEEAGTQLPQRNLYNKFHYHFLIGALLQNQSQVIAKINVLPNPPAKQFVYSSAITGIILQSHLGLLTQLINNKESKEDTLKYLNQEIFIPTLHHYFHDRNYPIFAAALIGNEEAIRLFHQNGAKIDVTVLALPFTNIYTNLLDVFALIGNAELFDKFEEEFKLNAENSLLHAAFTLKIDMMRHLILKKEFSIEFPMQVFVEQLLSSKLDGKDLSNLVEQFTQLLKDISAPKKLVAQLFDTVMHRRDFKLNKCNSSAASLLSHSLLFYLTHFINTKEVEETPSKDVAKKMIQFNPQRFSSEVSLSEDVSNVKENDNCNNRIKNQ